MKKATAIMLVFLLLLGVFAGCGKKDSAENPTGEVSVNAQQEEAPETTKSDPKNSTIDLSCDEGKISYVRFEKAHPVLTDDDNDDALVFVFEFTNYQSSPAQVQSAFDIDFYQNGAELTDSLSYTSGWDDEAKDQYDLVHAFFNNALKDGTVTFGCLVQPKDDSPITINVTANNGDEDANQMMEVDIRGGGTQDTASPETTAAAVTTAAAGTTEAKEDTKPIKLGETVETNDFKYTINSVDFTYDIEPSDTSGYYRHYEAGSGKVFIRIEATYYNRSKRDVCIRDLPKLTADYDNGYTYSGQSVVDDGDGTWTWGDSYVVCEPLNTCNVTGMIECAEVVESSSSPLKILITLGSDVYEYVVRA